MISLTDPYAVSLIHVFPPFFIFALRRIPNADCYQIILINSLTSYRTIYFTDRRTKILIGVRLRQISRSRLPLQIHVDLSNNALSFIGNNEFPTRPEIAQRMIFPHFKLPHSIHLRLFLIRQLDMQR